MSESIVVAAFWGGLAAISLIIGAVVAVRLHPSERVTGAVMGFGAGAADRRHRLRAGAGIAVAGRRLVDPRRLRGGALTFFVGDWLIDVRVAAGIANGSRAGERCG